MQRWGWWQPQMQIDCALKYPGGYLTLTGPDAALQWRYRRAGGFWRRG